MSAEATIPHEALKEVVSRIESELGHVVCLAVDVLFNTMKDAANRPKEAFQAAKTILKTFRWEKLLGQWERDNRVPISESRLNHLSLMGIDLTQSRHAHRPKPPQQPCQQRPALRLKPPLPVKAR